MDEEVTVTVYDGNKVVDSGILASIHTDQHGGGLTTWHGQFKQTAPVAYGRSYLIETNDGRRGRILVGKPVGSGHSFQGRGSLA